MSRLLLLFTLIFIGFIFAGYLWNKNLQLKVSLSKRVAQRTKDDLMFLQNIINALPNQIFIHDVNHKLLLSNCTGVECGNCQNCSLAKKDSPDHKVIEDSQELAHVLEVGEIIQRDVDVHTCSAGLKTIDYFRTRIDGPSDIDECVLTVVNDVSEQKDQERALRAANETAQQAVQSRERFLASMSHELRTPIAGMAGLLEMLKIRTQDEDTLIMLDNIIASTRHLHLLVNDILDFSKLEAQQLALDLRECHLLQEAGELLRVHCAAAHKKNLKFEVNWKPTTIKVVQIDPLRLGQIMNNILSNAIKFTEKGKVSVDVALDEKNVHVSVTDTGVGMNKELTKTVFNPFFQADSTIARRYGGTGLGLSIVNNLLNVMDGEIYIDSEPGVGTTVSFIIPHKVVRRYRETKKIVNAKYHGSDPVVQKWVDIWNSDRTEGTSTKYVNIFDDAQVNESLCDKQFNIVIKSNMENFRTSKGKCVYLNSTPFFADLLFDAVVGALPDTGVDGDEVLIPLSGKVLVAEDNPINQLVFKQQLKEIGLDVDIVDNGLVAWECLESNPTDYDMLITDCHMPVMDGYELVNRLRQSEKFSNMALIGCTAEDSRVANEKAQHSGFDDVLYKPYGINRLYKLISKYLISNQNESGFWVTKYDKADAQLLSHVYVETMQSDLERLLESRNDRKKLRDIAHRIKGGAGSIGESNIQLCALELEKCMQHREGNLAELFDSLVGDITVSIDKTKAWINDNQA